MISYILTFIPGRTFFTLLPERHRQLPTHVLASRKATTAVCLVALLGLQGIASANPPRAPATPPPPLSGPTALPAPAQAPVPRGALVEWTYHKTADGSHPNGDEQAMLWLMNRARSDPGQEGQWLASSTEWDVAFGRDYFQVDLGLLRQEFSSYSAAPPAAFDVRLYQAAYEHSVDLIARNAQDHTGQFERIDSSGFYFSSARGNVFSYAHSPLHAHAGFNIDWGGTDGTGMQTGRGHRQAIMAMDGNYTNVGLAAVPETDPQTSVGPYVVTGNFCEAYAGAANHFNRFVIGTLWEDLDDNDRYDPGEGIAGVQVMPDRGGYFAVTSAGGGYAFPATETGTYSLSFSGAGVNGQLQVPVAEVSVLADYRLDTVTGSTCPGCLDVDGDGTPTALTDGLLVVRYLFGLRGTALINGALGFAATRDSSQIAGYLELLSPDLDIDANGQVAALTDGLLVVRYLFGLRGDSLISGAVGTGAGRSTADAIDAYIFNNLE